VAIAPKANTQTIFLNLSCSLFILYQESRKRRYLSPTYQCKYHFIGHATRRRTAAETSAMNGELNSVQNIFCRRFLAGLATKYGVSGYMKCIHLQPLLLYRQSSTTYLVVQISLCRRIPLQRVQTEHRRVSPPILFQNIQIIL